MCHHHKYHKQFRIVVSKPFQDGMKGWGILKDTKIEEEKMKPVILWDVSNGHFFKTMILKYQTLILIMSH